MLAGTSVEIDVDLFAASGAGPIEVRGKNLSERIGENGVTNATLAVLHGNAGETVKLKLTAPPDVPPYELFVLYANRPGSTDYAYWPFIIGH